MKDLMSREPRGKNFAANFTEFEVVPTRQYWMHLSVAEAQH